MSRIDRYDVVIEPVSSRRLRDQLVEAIRDWTELEIYDYYASSRRLSIWGERRLAAGTSWEMAHKDLVEIVHGVAPRVTVSSRWWDGDREPDDEFVTEPAEERKPTS